MTRTEKALGWFAILAGIAFFWYVVISLLIAIFGGNK